MIANLIRELIDARWTREIKQIKEKYGELCFYANGLPENGMEIIMKYEARSRTICEICGTKKGGDTILTTNQLGYVAHDENKLFDHSKVIVI